MGNLLVKQPTLPYNYLRCFKQVGTHRLKQKKIDAHIKTLPNCLSRRILFVNSIFLQNQSPFQAGIPIQKFCPHFSFPSKRACVQTVHFKNLSKNQFPSTSYYPPFSLVCTIDDSLYLDFLSVCVSAKYGQLNQVGTQCDQMAKLCFQQLDIFTNENLPKISQIVPK